MVKLVSESPLFAMDQEFINLFYKKKPTDCILYSEDGIQFKIHREILSQTEPMQNILTSAKESCCQNLEIICPCSKVELEYVVKFFYTGKLNCESSFDFAIILKILTKVFGFPEKFIDEWQEEFEISENISDQPNSENDITNSTKIFDVDFNIDIKNEVEITEDGNDIANSTKIFNVDFDIDIKNEVDLDSIEEGLSNQIIVPLKTKKFNSDDIKETSQSVMPFKCKNCDAGFMKKIMLKRHIKVIHEEGFKVASNFKSHQMIRTTEKPSANSYIEKGHNIKTEKSDGTYFCKFCKEDFLELEALKMHNQVHSSKNRTCKICNKNFSTRSHLLRHEKIHMGVKPFSCKFCQLKFSQKANVNHHEKVHIRKGHNTKTDAEDGTYFCKFCNEDFAALEALKLHEQVHSSKDHTCKICNKKFTSRSLLLRHEKIH